MVFRFLTMIVLQFHNNLEKGDSRAEVKNFSLHCILGNMCQLKLDILLILFFQKQLRCIHPRHQL